jgi:hypothetical protein
MDESELKNECILVKYFDVYSYLHHAHVNQIRPGYTTNEITEGKIQNWVEGEVMVIAGICIGWGNW